MRRHRHIKRLSLPEVSLTPLIDTFATLLLIFMVTAPMVQNSIKVDLPRGKSKEVGGVAEELIVTLAKNAKSSVEIYFNNEPLTRQELTNAVRKAIGKREETPVFVRADEKIPYGNVIEVVDELKQAGVKYVAMSTRPAG